jgi:serine/threonine-protein kinase RsbW
MRFIRLFTAKFRANEAEEDIEIAVREALANALVHGNRENPDKHIDITCRCSMDGEVFITVRDEGDGFNSLAVPDPTDPQNQLLTHGRGVYLMKSLMDEVSFEERGNVVRMRKRIR